MSLTKRQLAKVNKIRAEKARAALHAKYTEEELQEIRSRAGKANNTKFDSERGREAALRGWEKRRGENAVSK